MPVPNASSSGPSTMASRLAQAAADPRRHARILLFSTLATRLLIAALVLLASYLPRYRHDHSPRALLPDVPNSLVARWTATLLRWDAFHFSDIALNGYVFEYEWAFFPATPAVMHHVGQALRALKNHWNPLVHGSTLSLEDVLQGGALAALFADLLSPFVLYELSLHVLRSPSLALLSSLLSLLPSSTATLRHAAYAEPFFALLSYSGMLFAIRRQYVRASACFTVASTFRSNGLLLGGFIIWPTLIQPAFELSPRLPSVTTVLKIMPLSLLPLVPSLAHQGFSYLMYCLPEQPAVLSYILPFPYSHASHPLLTHPHAPFPLLPPPSVPYPIADSPPRWCRTRKPYILHLPSVYAYVQDRYWSVGFLRYWQLNKLGNFAFAFPVLVPLVWFASWHLKSVLLPQLLAARKRLMTRWKERTSSSSRYVGPPSTPSPSPSPSPSPPHSPRLSGSPSLASHSPFLTSALTPHAIHALIISAMLIFVAHVQIALRLAPSMPIIHWAGAYLISGGKASWPLHGLNESTGEELKTPMDEKCEEKAVLFAKAPIVLIEDDEMTEKRTGMETIQPSPVPPPTRRPLDDLRGWIALPWGLIWTSYVLVWGMASIVLWVSYRPPP